MGVGLALLTGEHHRGRLEGRLARGRSYFQAGAFHAAAGDLAEYVEARPDDREGILELARAQQLTGMTAEATVHYRRAFDLCLKEGAIADLLDIYREWVRQLGAGSLRPGELSKAAYYLEKQLDYRGALDVYGLLYKHNPHHPEGQRALVRVIVLLQGKVTDPLEAARWFDEAYRTMPPGSWRDFLEREFNLPAGPRAIGPADPASVSVAALSSKPGHRP